MRDVGVEFGRSRNVLGPEERDQLVRRFRTHLAVGYVDGRQGRVDDARQFDVVEAGDRDVLWHAEASVPCGAEGAHGQHVIAAEHDAGAVWAGPVSSCVPLPVVVLGASGRAAGLLPDEEVL